jgi:hypothetical protein
MLQTSHNIEIKLAESSIALASVALKLAPQENE